MKKTLITILVILIIVFAGVMYINYTKEPVEVPEPPLEYLINRVDYVCKNEKAIVADYFEGEVIPVEAGEMPIPSGKVNIALSDGRQMELSQTISASGVRYANEDESFVFWSKGDGAFILEDDEQTFAGCVAVATDPGDLPNVYFDDEVGFTVRYPEGYTLDDSELNKVKFIIPATLAEDTNLSDHDTGVSIVIRPEALECKADLFIDGEVEMQSVNDGDVEYSFAALSQGAAGNYYEEEVWVLPYSRPCAGVHYLIHSTNIDNYPEDAVVEFDQLSLIEQFNRIRQSFRISPL